MNCPKCGIEMLNNDVFCRSCGQKNSNNAIELHFNKYDQDYDKEFNKEEEKRKEKQYNNKVIALVVAVVFIIGSVGIYDYVNQKAIEDYDFWLSSSELAVAMDMKSSQEMLDLVDKTWYNWLYGISDPSTDVYMRDFNGNYANRIDVVLSTMYVKNAKLLEQIIKNFTT